MVSGWPRRGIGAHIPPLFRAPRTVVASPSPVPIVPLSSIDVRHASFVPSLLLSPAPFPLPRYGTPTGLTTLDTDRKRTRSHNILNCFTTAAIGCGGARASVAAVVRDCAMRS